MTKRLMKAKHPNEIVDVTRVALKKPSRRPPLSVDGATARQRLDRPSRRLGRGEGGAVALPIPSLADASKGIGYDDMHREIRKGERRHEIAGGILTTSRQWATPNALNP